MGRYHLVERLAVGGMAEVFLAADPLVRSDASGAAGGPGRIHALDRLVVVKRILPHLAEDEAFVEMFLREARVAARIAHPNVVEIHELGESGGHPFIAMEYVPGSTLKQLVRAARDARDPLPVDVVVHLLSQACAGAHAAHELVDAQGRPYGLVHRDLTPHNLMVTDQAHVKLLDFGIAKPSSGADHTRTGMLKGKISYMSPEQCRQERLDRRSDVFALGIVAWELLAGRKPFSGRSELATMQAIVTGDLPHLREVRPDVPEPVAAAIHQALALDPDQRFATADGFRRELRDAARRSGVPADEDRAAARIRELLGPAHARRRGEVERARDRTLGELSAAPLAPADPEPDPSGSNGRWTGPGRATAGIAVSVALVAALGVGALAATALVGVWWVGGADGFDPFARFGVGAASGPARPPPAGEPIEVVLAPTLDPAVLIAEHEPIRTYLEGVLSRPVHLQVAESYEDAAAQVVTGEVPYAFLPPLTVERARDQAELEVLVTKVVDGSASTDAYLLVPRESPARSITDLEGQVICYSDPLSQTGYALPRAHLAAQGLDPELDFVPRFSGNHAQVLRDLIDGVCAVGGTFSGNYQTADQQGIPTARLRILAIIGSAPHDALVAGRAADPTVSRALAEALVAFDPARDAGAPRVGESERITGFVRPTP